MLSKANILVSIFLVGLCIQSVTSVKLQKGTLFLVVSQEHKDNIEHKVNINSRIPSTLELTQSSRIKIEARLEFSQQQFKPEFVSFRLKHAVHQNLTEPVLAKYDSNIAEYRAYIDLGDPKHIKPFSDNYQFEVIVADASLENNVRNIVAYCNVVFRKSWTSVPSSDLHYSTENIIETSAPTVREDPPKLFTIFVVLAILLVDTIFVYGLRHLKVNFSLFPKASVGFLSNTVFLVFLGLNLLLLIKFWINWTFLDTLQYLSLLIIGTAFVANWALKNLKKN